MSPSKRAAGLHLGRTAGPPHSTTLVKKDHTKMFLQAQPTLPWMCGGGRGQHRFKWAACLGDRDHTKLKADSTNLGTMPCTFYTAPGSRFTPTLPPPQQEKFSSQNEARRWEFAITLPRVAQSSWADVLDHLVCAQMGKERAFRHRSPSE